MSLFITFFITFFSSFLFLYLFIPILRKNIIDIPNERSSHESPIPSGGGIVFALIGSIMCSYFGNYIPLFCMPLAFLGLIDDRYHLPSSIRYIFQTLVSTILIFNSPVSNYILSSNIFFTIFLYVFFIIFCTGNINFFNFMDGIDGLVSSCVIVFLVSASFIVQPTYLPMVGALCGFTILNWSPAKVFMGDAGSTFLGALVTALIINSINLNNFLGMFIISFPIFGDACVCVIRRYLAGQNVFKPHKLHLYQRLVQTGISHSSVSLIYLTSTIFLSISFLSFGLYSAILSLIFIICIAIYLDAKVALPFNIQSK